MATRPTGPPTIRMYNVGFGDCFLLTFPYASGGDRHLLIDFGSHPRPAGAPSGFMEAIARDIAARCQGGRLAVVATHRHADHIAGFATRGGKASGDIIRALKPDIVIQPWTEHPTAARDAHAPALRAAARGFHRSLAAMERFAAAFVQGLDGLPRHVPRRLRERLAYIGEDVIKNKSAVENLMTMGRRKARYVHAGRASGLATFLPGVKIHVLGPPTLAQAPDIRAYAKESEDYWLRRRQIALAGRASAKGRGEAGLFARAQRRPAGKAPAHATWFIERMRRAYADELLGIVTVLDKVLNNTSIILLIEVAGQKLLFPGDAQLENWSYALTKYRKLLQGVTVYKVGHHGSLNATPRRLWTLLTAGETAAAPDAFTTLLSTLPDVHGGEDDRPTEVPRRTLVDALKARSRYHSTLDGPGVGQAQVIPPP